MNKFLAILIILLISNLSIGQECPSLTQPLDGATNVPVDTQINWNAVEGVTGYIVSVGTTPSGTEIISEQANGSSTSIRPPTGLPENTLIYVTITLFFFDRPNIVCESQSFTTEDVTTVPECTTINFPQPNNTDVNQGANIIWDYASRATGYRITVGTTPGGTDIANNIDVGNQRSYDPPGDLPANTQIYVTITPYNENGSATNCAQQTFTTSDQATLPGCSRLITPVNGETNVSLSPLVEWEAVPGATGYRIFIGKTPTENDVLDGGVFTNTSTFVFNFEDNSVYFVRIVPFNEAGEAQGCEQETFSTILGCGPFFDPDTGELVNLEPENNFPDQVGICSGASETFTSMDEAVGYRWFRDQFGSIELLSESREVVISEPGSYLIELYNFSEDGSIECTTTKPFEVVTSEAPTIDDALVVEQETSLDITILASGDGDYEYSLSADGPFQDSNVILGAAADTEIVYARDKNGCGIDEFQIQFRPSNNGFPKFFTPNGDGFNDRWQYLPKPTDNFILLNISIFDRYGKLLKQMSPNTSGWDGTFGGSVLPSTDYWYKAITIEGQVFSGHFSLKR